MSFRSLELPPLRSRNRKGDLAEAAFVSRALRMGFTISRPINTNSRYDFIVEAGGRYNRVQIKSLWRSKRPYSVPVRSGAYLHRRYYAEDVDFFGLYVAEHDAWYIVPLAEVGARFSVFVRPHVPGCKGKFERFREAWHLLLPRGVKIGDLKAMADPQTENIDPSVRAPFPSPRLGIGRAPSG